MSWTQDQIERLLEHLEKIGDYLERIATTFDSEDGIGAMVEEIASQVTPLEYINRWEQTHAPNGANRTLAQAMNDSEVILVPLIEYLCWNLGDDHSGDPSLFVRVVLRDTAAEEKNLRNASQAVQDTIHRQAFGLYPGTAYFNFRSAAEVALGEKLEPAWRHIR
jgi:hypothetical protein